MKKIFFGLLALAPPLIVYGIFAQQLNFIQDDAFISFRYVANFLDGHGLVFNVGERVEGFTNFGWIILLILLAELGFEYVAAAQWIGFIFGAAFIVISYLTALRVFERRDWLFALFPVYLLGFSMALAYWAQAGLETAAFAFFASLSFLCYLRKSRGLIFSLLIAVWLRPEGALVAAILILIELILEKRIPKYTITCSGIAFFFSLPYLAFKFFYYGSILPNPFYAKTGISLDQLSAGADYAALFFSHYGFYSAGFIITALFWKKLSNQVRAVLLFFFFYTAYIVVVGGDVLKVHRFFLPVFGFSAIIFTYSIRILTNRLNQKTRNLVLFLVALPLIAMTYKLPEELIHYYHEREKGLVESMSLLAQDIKRSDSTNFSAAHTTIGAFSYELIGHPVIDMLGLTDSMIARHPEQSIEELKTTWREQNFNATYVLKREPDYIVFSTGDKPSAPAEQALLLYPQFHESYVSFGWFHVNPAYSSGGILLPAFKKVRPFRGRIEPTYPPEFVRLYKKGSELTSAGLYQDAIEIFDTAISISPEPYYKYLLYSKSLCHMRLQQHDTTMVLLNSILAQDSMVFDAHKNLYIYAVVYGDSTAAQFHRKRIKELVPWFLPRLEYEALLVASQSKLQ